MPAIPVRRCPLSAFAPRWTRSPSAGRDAFLAVLEEAALDEQVGIWRAMIIVLDSGEHCPHHFRGRKP